MTVVMITHRLEEILFSDLTAVLSRGKLAFYGETKDLLDSTTFARLGIKEPPLFKLWRNLKSKGLLEESTYPTVRNMVEDLVERLCL